MSRSPLRYTDCAVAEAGGDERNGAVRIGEAPADAVSGRLLPLRGQARFHRVIVISSLIWAADPSAKRPSAVRASFGEPADILR